MHNAWVQPSQRKHSYKCNEAYVIGVLVLRKNIKILVVCYGGLLHFGGITRPPPLLPLVSVTAFKPLFSVFIRVSHRAPFVTRCS